MRGKGGLDVDRIVVSPGRVQPDAHWEFCGRMSHGAIHHDTVLDANEELPLPWWFLLNVTKELRKGRYVLLQALDYPRTKKGEATTRGGDGDSLVAVMPGDDHAQTIRLFFATKAWPLQEGLRAATRKALGRDNRR